MTSNKDNPAILIVEDDPDQMDLLVNLTLGEIQALMDDPNTNEPLSQALKDIKILKVSNVKTLEKAVSVYKNVLLALLDCNIPDSKGGDSNDQLVKTNHRITGQHRSVDLVIKHLPSTPITTISSLNRFQRTVTRHYKNEYDLDIDFISKSDLAMISKNIGDHLRQHIASLRES
jgi:CheY-like chemotaxis protein